MLVSVTCFSEVSYHWEMLLRLCVSYWFTVVIAICKNSFSLFLSLHSVHCGSIRQTATILSMNRDCLRTGDKASVHFRFIKTPEYLHCDQRLVFREGRTKAVGTITKVVRPSGRLRIYAYSRMWLKWWVWWHSTDQIKFCWVFFSPQCCVSA